MCNSVRITFVLSIVLTALGLSSPLLAHSRQAPPGMFKDLDDETLGDTLVVNANAAGDSLAVEALDAEGKVIEGFVIADCTPITTDSLRRSSSTGCLVSSSLPALNATTNIAAHAGFVSGS